MNEHEPTAAAENPFNSRQIRPGALSFLFPPGESAAALVDRLQGNGWRGQILGPHGSGKSALLAALVPAIEQAQRQTCLVELHDGQRRMPLDLKRTPEGDDRSVLIVDGYEQLGLWHRYRVKRFCRRHGVGLLVTAHAPVGLPDLFHTAATLSLARKIVEELQRGHPSRVTADDVAERFSRHGGDLRETLFDLYDLYERRRKEQRSAP